MYESTDNMRDGRSPVPEMGHPLVLSLATIAALIVCVAAYVVQDQATPVWLTSTFLVVVMVNSFAMPAMNRRARASHNTPSWGRTFSAAAFASAIIVPLLLLFPVTSDTQQWGWVMVVVAAGEIALAAVAAVLSARWRRTSSE